MTEEQDTFQKCMNIKVPRLNNKKIRLNSQTESFANSFVKSSVLSFHLWDATL